MEIEIFKAMNMQEDTPTHCELQLKGQQFFTKIAVQNETTRKNAHLQNL